MANLLAAAGENGTVVLFDVESGAIRQRLEGHSGDVWDVAFDPEGAWLVTGGDDGKIIRWSLPTDDAPAKQLQAWEAPASGLFRGYQPGRAAAGNRRGGQRHQPLARRDRGTRFAVSKGMKSRLLKAMGSRSARPGNVSRALLRMHGPGLGCRDRRKPADFQRT